MSSSSTRRAALVVGLAVLVSGMHAIGWGNLSRFALDHLRSGVDTAWPILRLIWPALAVLGLAGLLSKPGRMVLAHALRHIRSSWLVAILAVVVLALVFLAVLRFPSYLVERSLDQAAEGSLSPSERLKAENDARTTLLQGIAGLLLVVGAGATWRQIQINREGQITERFSKAIDHLGEGGDDKIDVRLGGIYALERIAYNSKDDRATIAEILTAYVRGHAAWTDPPDNPPASLKELSDLRLRMPDVQAVMTVLGRRAWIPGKFEPFVLSGVDLRKAFLRFARLGGVNLSHAHLEGANLYQATLHWADLSHAHLEGADLSHANLYWTNLSHANLKLANLVYVNLEDADLGGADLEDAKLTGVHLEHANLKGANLKRADLSPHAHLQGASLIDAKLEDADLGGADLEGAFLISANLKGVNLGNANLKGANLGSANLEAANLGNANLKGANLDGANLKGAKVLPTTIWPEGFNWRAARVEMVDRDK